MHLRLGFLDLLLGNWTSVAQEVTAILEKTDWVAEIAHKIYNILRPSLGPLQPEALTARPTVAHASASFSHRSASTVASRHVYRAHHAAHIMFLWIS